MINVEVDGHWPADGLERVECCPVCGSASRTLLHESLPDQVFFCAPGRWTLYRCEKCNSGYLDPRPTTKTIGLAYSRYFTHVDSGQGLQGLSVLQRLRRTLANGYRNERFGINRQPSSRIGAYVTRLLPMLRAIVEASGRHLSQPKTGATLLDVGCGNGDFLEIAAEMGWKAEGVELDPRAVAVARGRGLIVYQGSIEYLENRSDAYDVITLSHVIEHVHDPLKLLASCFRLLKPGGHLWLETPNLDAVGHTRYGRHWLALDPPRHLILFTWASLRSALCDAGFVSVSPLPRRPLTVRTFSASEAIRKGKDPYQHADTSLRVRWSAWRAERRVEVARREYVSIRAQKPVVSKLGEVRASMGNEPTP